MTRRNDVVRVYCIDARNEDGGTGAKTADGAREGVAKENPAYLMRSRIMRAFLCSEPDIFARRTPRPSR
jgi:hypothetical protein